MSVFPSAFPDNIYSLRIYKTGVLDGLFASHAYPFPHPVDIFNGMSVADARQAWSNGIRLRVSAGVGNYVEFSFNGVDIHGRIETGEDPEVYLNRYEGGISVRGQGTFWLDVW
jgi:hypothetical protein